MGVAPGAYPIVPPLPEYEQRTTVTQPTSGTDTKTETLSPEQTSALEGVGQAAQAQKSALDRKAEQDRAIAKVEGQGVELETAAAESRAAMLAGPEMKAADDYVKWARQHTKDETAKLTSKPSPALFADSEGWDKVRKTIALAGAGIGDAIAARAAILAGQTPSGRSTVRDLIQMDIDRQKLAIDKLKDNVVMARTGLSDAVEARRALMADIDLKHAEMLKRAQLITKARLASLKLDRASIDNAKEVAELDRGIADAKAEYVKGHSTSVTKRVDSAKTSTETINRQPVAGDAGKMPAQQSALARQVLNEVEKLRAAEPLTGKELDSLQDKALQAEAANESVAGGKLLGGALATGGRAAGVVPRNRYEGLTEQSRQTAQTLDAMKQYLIHLMTGAGSSAKEATEKAEAFGWVSGDTPKTMSAKLDRAEQLAKQYLPGAGSEAPKPAAAQAASAPASEYTKARLEQARGIASDAKQPPEKRKRAREYIRAAADAGVR